MKSMPAADAKNAFGTFLDAVQREPVIVTKKNRPVAMMISMQDIKALFGDGEDAVVRALEESRIDKRLALARQEMKDGKTILADDAFFEERKERIRRKYALE